MSKRVLSVGIVTVLILLVILYMLVDKDNIEEQVTTPRLSPPTKAEDVNAFNQALNEMQSRNEKSAKNKTPEKEAEEKSFLNKLAAMSKAAIKDIKFYGKIVDQKGDPVSGVIVEHVGLNAIYASGSGTRRATTNDDGLFVVDASGTAFVVEKFTKPGYDFPPRQRFVNERGQNKSEILWSDYTKDNPFVFKAWKVADKGYPKTSQSEAVFGFKPGTMYSMDYSTSNKKKVKKEGALDLDLQVLFNRDDASWNLSLVVPDGGLLESTDLYMNMAPTSGYISTVNFTGTSDDRAIIKKYYIHSRGKLYGRLDFEIIPYYRKKSAIVTTYVMNLDGGRNLEVK